LVKLIDMKREILFRGYSETLNKWVEGDLAYMFNNPKNACIMPECFFATRNFGEEDENGNPIIEDTMALGGYIPVHPDSVGQFTGLLDCNGVKIFDNDIISVKVKHGFNSDLLNEFKDYKNLDSLNGIGNHFSGIVRLDFLRGVMFENPENGYQEPMFTRHLDIMRNHSEITITGNTFKQ